MIEFKHPFNEERCLQRLIHEYEKHPELIVAFDFDNTIFDTHENGGDYSDVIELLKAAKDSGFCLVLFTAESDVDKLEWKREVVKEKLGFYPDYINTSHVKSECATNGKMYYNILLDDQVAITAKALESSKEYIEYTTKVCSRFSDEEIQLLRSMTEEEYQLFENWIKSCKDLKEEDDIK